MRSFLVCLCKGYSLLNASWQAMQDHGTSHDSADHVDNELEAVVPNDRFHAAEERVDDRRDADDRDAHGKRDANNFFQSNSGQKQPEAIAQVSGHEKDDRSRHLRGATKSLVEQLVSSVDLAFEISRQQKPNNHHATEDESERQLEKTQVAAVGKGNSRHAEERRGTGLGGDNRTQDNPPGQFTIAEPKGGEALDASTDPKPKQHDAQQVRDQNN